MKLNKIDLELRFWLSFEYRLKSANFPTICHHMCAKHSVICTLRLTLTNTKHHSLNYIAILTSAYYKQ